MSNGDDHGGDCSMRAISSMTGAANENQLLEGLVADT